MNIRIIFNVFHTFYIVFPVLILANTVIMYFIGFFFKRQPTDIHDSQLSNSIVSFMHESPY